MKGMARRKATITVDQERLAEARRLTGAPSASATIDLALGQLIRAARIQADVRAYALEPQSADEIALAGVPVDLSAISDETDWAALYDGDRT